MQRSMLAFTISAAVVLATETSYGMQQGPVKNAAAVSAAAAPAPAAKRLAAKRVRAAATPKVSVVQTAPEAEPVQEQLRRDPILAAMISGRMPAGTDLMVVAAGFRDVRQFAGAVSASKNLGIPFYQLKRRMVGDGMSLGLAIQDVAPHTNYKYATRLAEDEAAAIVGTPIEPQSVPVATLVQGTR